MRQTAACAQSCECSSVGRASVCMRPRAFQHGKDTWDVPTIPKPHISITPPAGTPLCFYFYPFRKRQQACSLQPGALPYHITPQSYLQQQQP